MKCDVGDWTYVRDALPKQFTGPYWVACRAKDGCRNNWVGLCVLYGYGERACNPWGIPILDNTNYEAYAWMWEWYPEPPEEKLNG